MKTKYTNIASLILALSLPSIASAAVVTIPAGIADGTVSSFTIGAGDSSTDAVNIASTIDTAATLTVNGSWLVAGEIQLGGLTATDTAQDPTLNIGSTGVVSVGSMWVAGGWVGTAAGTSLQQAIINIAQGGQFILNDTGFGIRSTWDLAGTGGASAWTMDGSTDAASTQNSLGVFTLLWNQGVLQKDGSSAGAFGDSFSFTPSAPGAQTGTLTAIPEPSAALLGGLGMLCLLRRRRA